MTNRFVTVSAFSALCAVSLFSSVANAADLLPPPPPQRVVEIRDTIKDWTGVYIGGVGGITCMDNDYVPSIGPDPELNGCGFHGGLVGGVNYQFNRAVIGLEGDWTWGGKNATNVLDATRYSVNYQSSVRARAGWLASDDTLLYVTGGFGMMRGTLNALVGPASVPMSDTKTHYGYVVGGGIEHAFTSNFHARIEYLFADYNLKRYNLQVAGACGVIACRADLDASQVHSFRVGVSYNFSVGSW